MLNRKYETRVFSVPSDSFLNVFVCGIKARRLEEQLEDWWIIGEV